LVIAIVILHKEQENFFPFIANFFTFIAIFATHLAFCAIFSGKFRNK